MGMHFKAYEGYVLCLTMSWFLILSLHSSFKWSCSVWRFWELNIFTLYTYTRKQRGGNSFTRNESLLDSIIIFIETERSTGSRAREPGNWELGKFGIASTPLLFFILSCGGNVYFYLVLWVEVGRENLEKRYREREVGKRKEGITEI